jgi:hypothetical protein
VQWIKRVELGNRFSTAIDNANNIYVAAYSLSKYDSNGTLLWTIDTNTLFHYQFFANCLGPDGIQYVAGQTIINNQWAGVVAAYDPSGMQLWSKVFSAPAGTTWLFMHGLTLSGDQLFAGGWLYTIDANNIIQFGGNYTVSMQVPEPTSVLVLFMCASLAVGRRSASPVRFCRQH